MPKKLDLPKEKLLELYYGAKLSTVDIGKVVGCSGSNVAYTLRELGIPRRSKSEAAKIVKRKRGHRIGIAFEQLRELYTENKLSTEEVARELGVSSATIHRRLKQLEISRSHSQAATIAINKGLRPQNLSGEANGNWKGGRTVTTQGYIKVHAPGHPRAYNGTVLEHILVWEKIHNKALPKEWVIHHINGVRTDNRPKNLIAMPRLKHDRLIPIQQQKIRELEAENARLRRALEDSQMIFYIGEN